MISTGSRWAGGGRCVGAGFGSRIDPWELDRAVTVGAGAGAVFLQGFEVTLFLQDDQGFDIAVEFVNIADSAFECFDFVAQGLHSARLALHAAVDGLNLFEQVITGSGDLLGSFSGYGLNHGFGFFQGFVDAPLDQALGLDLFGLQGGQALDAAVDDVQGFEAGIEVDYTLAHSHHHGVELVDAAVHAHAHDQEEDQTNQHQTTGGAKQDQGFFMSDFGQGPEFAGGFVHLTARRGRSLSGLAGDVGRIEHDLGQRLVLLVGAFVDCHARVSGRSGLGCR